MIDMDKDFRPELSLSDLPHDTKEMKMLIEEYSLEEIYDVIDRDEDNNRTHKGHVVSTLAKCTGDIKALLLCAEWYEEKSKYDLDYLEGANIYYSILVERVPDGEGSGRYKKGLKRVEKIIRDRGDLAISDLQKDRAQPKAGEGMPVYTGEEKKEEPLEEPPVYNEIYEDYADNKESKRTYVLDYAKSEQIRKFYKAGWTLQQLATAVGCSKSMVSRVVNNISWKDPVTPYKTNQITKLTEDSVRDIRKLRLEGKTFNQIKKDHYPNLAKSTVRRAALGLTWRHVK